MEGLSKGPASVLPESKCWQEKASGQKPKAMVCSSHLPSPPFLAQYKMSGWKLPTPGFSLGREKVGVCLQCSRFSRGYPRDWFLSCLSQSADETQHILDVWLLLKNKRVLRGLLLHQRAQYSKQRLIQYSSLSLKGQREEWNMYPTFRLLRVLLLDWFLSHLTWNTDGTQHILQIWGSLRIKETWNIWSSFRELVDRHQWE